MRIKIYVLTLLLATAGSLATGYAAGSSATGYVAGSASGSGPGHNITFAVMSDPHLMAPSLLVKDGKAFEDYMKHDRKLLVQSDAITAKLVSDIINKKPDFVLVCGDLTKDGEKISHEMFAGKYLSRFKNAGIKVYVIPGNHDINNPHAVSFNGNTQHHVSSVSPAEFASIYRNYGYGGAIARDTASLTYSARITDSLVLIAIDDCKYYENSFDKNTCITSGVIKPATLKFIKKEAAAAHRKGYRVIAMMHHGLVEHWKWQSKAMKEYLTDGWKKQVRFFARNHIDIVFTGHFHAQDISKKHGVYDIETGSTVTYPCPYRIVSIEGKRMEIKSFFINSINYTIPKGESFHQYARSFLQKAMPNIIMGMFSEAVPDSLKIKGADEVSKAYVADLAGDERYAPGDKNKIKLLSRQIRHYSWKDAYIFSHVSKYLWNDRAPADNNLTIKFK